VANYYLASKTNLDEALKDEDQSIKTEERFDNLLNKSLILEAMGRKDDATAARNQALEKASAQQLYFYGRQLQGQKKQERAFAIYRSNAKKFPDYWTSHVGLARFYSGERATSTKPSRRCNPLSRACRMMQQVNLEKYVKRLQSKDDINR